MRLVDPDGREIGDYYNWQGKRLGWDGQKDDNVYIVSGRIPKKFFDKKTGIVKSPDKVTIDVATSRSVIKEAVAVYDRTVANGGDNEECSAFDCNGNLVPGERGCGGESHLPIEEGTVSIHSHRLTETLRDGKVHIRTPELPSTIKNSGKLECDETTFLNFDLNIIVGKLQPDEFSDLRAGAMTFYGRIITDSNGDLPSTPYIGTMNISDARKIVTNHK